MGYLGNQITTVFPTSISVDSATISGNASVGGTLGVTGASTLTGNLTVSGLSNITLEADLWRVSSNLGMTSAVNDITANWERSDVYSHGVPLGTGMSESSGIFTFGQTGVYSIQLQGSFLVGSSSSLYTGMLIGVTTNNSAYNVVSSSYSNNNSGNTASYYAVTTKHIFDVTDTSTHKVKFAYENQVTTGVLLGNTNFNQTCVIFTRLGNT